MTLRIVLLGGSGFLGGAVLRQLQALGDGREAFCLSHQRPLPAYSFVHSCQGELPLMPLELLPRAPHVVVHCASKQTDPAGTGFGENLRGVERLLAAINPHTRAILYASSFSVYGDGPQEGVTETAPLQPRTPLAKSRADCEGRLLSWARQGGCKVAILRARFVVGEGDRHFLPGLARLARARVGVGDGHQRFSLIDVDDYARVILALARQYLDPSLAQADGPEIFNVGYRAPVSFNDILSALRHEGGLPPPRYRIPVNRPLIGSLRRLPSRYTQQLAERLQLLGYDHYGATDRLAAALGTTLIDQDPCQAIQHSARGALDYVENR